MDVLIVVALAFVAVLTVAATIVVVAFARLSTLARGIDDLRARVAKIEAAIDAGEPVFAPIGGTGVGAADAPDPAAAMPAVLAPEAEPSALDAAPFLPSADDTLETRIGGQWLLYAGVFAILLGVAYFEKLAFDNAWLSETARVIQGAAAGALLTYFGARFARAGYRTYGHAIEGAGFAALYVSAYASFNYYHLVSRPAAFALMVAITGAGVWTADRQRSQGLAVVSVGGGFLTPFLLPGTTDTHVALFGYDVILVAGTALLARRRNWPLVYITSFLATMLTVAAWADRFYTPDKYLSTEIFLSVFCAMFLYILRQCRTARETALQFAALVLVTAPVAYYAASLLILWDHNGALLLWLVLLMTAGALASVAWDARFGFGIWTAVALPLLVWSTTHGTPRWQSVGLATTGGIYAIALAAQLHEARRSPRPGGTEVAWLHANGLVMFGIAYLFVAAAHAAQAGTVAAVFAGWQAAVAWRLRQSARPEHATHFAALGLTLVAVAIALQFDGPAVTVGWAAESLVAVVLGYRADRPWLRKAALALFAVAAIRIEWLLFSPRPVGALVLLNTRAFGAAFVTGVAYAIAAQHARHATNGARRRLVAWSIIAAQILTLSLVTSEIDAYWAERGHARVQEMMRSIAWAVYGTALILIGLRRNYAPIRIFAIVVLAITVTKVFVIDLAQLERVYRVLSVIGVGIMLLVASYLYQRFRRGTRIGSTLRDGNARGPAA